jgi:hypothetical protein
MNSIKDDDWIGERAYWQGHVHIEEGEKETRNICTEL